VDEDLYQKPFVNRGIQNQGEGSGCAPKPPLYFYTLSFIVVPYKMATTLKSEEAETQPWQRRPISLPLKVITVYKRCEIVEFGKPFVVHQRVALW
jgi:hypothetical protein